MQKLLNVQKAIVENARNINYRGHDPYDGLYQDNLPCNLLKKNKLTRLVLIHANKRSVVNLRPLFCIKADINSKTLALFLSGLLKLGRVDDTQDLLELINKHKSGHTAHSAWGYYFDWQSRVFFQPANTPTVVATSFVCHALLDLYEVTKEEALLTTVKSSIAFFTYELNIYEDKNGLCFSYSPLDHSVIYNASALGLEVMARYLAISGQKDEKIHALISGGLEFIVKEQNADGSWFYGQKAIQHFTDHYHTAYLLESLENIDVYSKEAYQLKPAIEKGLAFYKDHLFTSEAAPKYFKNAVYPIESHCAGAAIKALCVLSKRHGEELFEFALNVSDWTIKNLFDENKGYFYYQKRKYWTNKINYLRWSQAWMFTGLAYLVHYGKKYGHSFD